MAEVWPLVGRVEELRFVAAALRSRTSRGGVVLAGAAGVGKTRLAREALRRAARQGSQTRWAYGTASARSTPFGAFEGLLGGLVRSRRHRTQAVESLARPPGHGH